MARSPASAERLLAELRPYIRDERVLTAIAAVPRDLFVPDDLEDHAWANTALPIGSGQTISQPIVVARMCELLELTGDEHVLDVGTGSGYHAAVLARLARDVWSIERKPRLVELARHNLTAAGVQNVRVVVGDGSAGYPPEAPYDAINVAAAARDVPPALEGQLAERGRLVVPVDGRDQRLIVVRRQGEVLERRSQEPVRFVPLVGDV
jgi:protein-L-isoaspartate(D-aspartate) O-methyltransferase